MKKTYVKPYLAVETFQLDAAIASSCSSQGKLDLGYTMDTCNLDDGRGTHRPSFGYFGKSCRSDVEVVGDGNDLICYHGPISQATDVAMNS